LHRNFIDNKIVLLNFRKQASAVTNMKILTIIGARPQFIKAAAVSRVLQNDSSFAEVLVHTGQHYDANMSDVFFQELGIPAPHYHLGIGSGAHGQQTGRMLEQLEQVLVREKPGAVLIYGDTNSTLAGALAASKLHIPVAHVEAGLRSFNRRMPEEINRVVSDHLSEWLFAPTQAAVANLAREGLAGDKVRLVGDVMYDVALHLGCVDSRPVLQKFGVQPRQYVLATIHRAENTDSTDRLHAILGALSDVARQVAVVLPLHPRTRAALAREGFDDKAHAGLLITEPVGYLDMVALERNARLIATDSGGVQKEAFFCRVPCVTLRDETEWVELVELGWNALVPPANARAVCDGILARLSAPAGHEPPPDLYGGGQAASRIAGVLRQAA
jgi:UDP-GlcNAc3NAcA epimerase